MDDMDKYEYTDIIKPDDLQKKTLSEAKFIPAIIVIAGDMFGHIINLQETRKVLFGRDEDCDVTIDNSALSRRHCVVRNENGIITLEDLNSTNGTFVDGVKLKKKVELKSGQRVFLGSVCAFKFAYQDDIDLDLNRLIFEKAIKDRLTGVYNRTYFDEVLKKEFSFHKRSKLPLSLIFFDLDDFKKVNDTFGHICGDEILKKVASVIQKNLREADYMFRFGGEEFVILLKNTEFEKAMKKGESLRKLVESVEVLCSKNSITITASFGVSSLENDEFPNYKRFLADADAAMYKAKELGKNMVIGYKVNG